MPLADMRRTFGEARTSELPAAPVLPAPTPTPDYSLLPSRSAGSSPSLPNNRESSQALRRQEMNKLLGID